MPSAQAVAASCFVPADEMADVPTTIVETLRRLCRSLLYLMPGCHEIARRGTTRPTHELRDHLYAVAAARRQALVGELLIGELPS